MSLTSQIRDKNSAVRRFFTKFENKEGVKECLALLQSTQPIRLPSFTPASFVVYSFIGTTTDYLIRYTANGNRLIFENTIAHKALESGGVFHSAFTGQNVTQHLEELHKTVAERLAMVTLLLREHYVKMPELDSDEHGAWAYESMKLLQRQDGIKRETGQDVTQHLQILYKIRKNYLDGRDATDHKAVYSATALAVMDNVFRSGYLPKLFYEPIPKDKKEQIKKSTGKGLKEKTTRFLFDEYYETLGGALYAQDISDLIRTFVTVNQSRESEFFDARFAVFNQALGNSGLVGGADFDCVIEYDDRLILTDIKTTIKPLTIEQLRQIIGYALLYDEKKDDFKFTDIGIYYSRSGSFRFLPIDSVVEKSLSGFKSVSQARKAFISEVKKT
jgi:hypothetical protein